MKQTVFLFGEAEKGDLNVPLICRSLPELADTLGNPPDESQAILYGVQALLYDREIIFFRVREEGFSHDEYIKGLTLLQNTETSLGITAICMPGVGDLHIIDLSSTVCQKHQSCLIISQQDLYDFLTSSK